MEGTLLTTSTTRWRLTSNGGVHRWRYVDRESSSRQSDPERYLLGLPLSVSL
jgi:hypothetical protein